jgi:hypothetical protein
MERTALDAATTMADIRGRDVHRGPIFLARLTLAEQHVELGTLVLPLRVAHKRGYVVDVPKAS